MLANRLDQYSKCKRCIAMCVYSTIWAAYKIPGKIYWFQAVLKGPIPSEKKLR